MRIAIISDIHANTTALNTVLEDIDKQKCDHIVCLGDIVGYGYDPDGCIEICKQRNMMCILGNHDAGMAGKLGLGWFTTYAAKALLRQQENVSEPNKSWLKQLPYNYIAGIEEPYRRAYAHGTFVRRPLIQTPSRVFFDYVLSPSDALSQYNCMIANNIAVLFIGHTHFAFAYLWDASANMFEQYLDVHDVCTIDCLKYSASIINVGSVGYPRTQPYSIYGIFDTESKSFQYRVLPFDFDDYIANMEKAKAPIPRWLPERQKEAAAKPL